MGEIIPPPPTAPEIMKLCFSGVNWGGYPPIQNDTDYTLLKFNCPNYNPWYYLLIGGGPPADQNMLHFRRHGYHGGLYFISVARRRYYYGAYLEYPQFVGDVDSFIGCCNNRIGPDLNADYYIKTNCGANLYYAAAGYGGKCYYKGE